MTKTLITRIIRNGYADTRNYRYRLTDSRDGTMLIYRIAIDALGTTAALTRASVSNPRGWQLVKEIRA